MTEYDPNVIDRFRVSGPPQTSTPEDKEARETLVERARKAATGRWTVAPGCAVDTPCGTRREGDLLGKGEVPAPTLRRLIARGVILEVDPDEVQRRADLKKATHILSPNGKGTVIDGQHYRPGDPLFPETLAVRSRPAYRFARKDGTIQEVPERPAQDGTARFQELIEAGKLVPNPAYEGPAAKKKPQGGARRES